MNGELWEVVKRQFFWVFLVTTSITLQVIRGPLPTLNLSSQSSESGGNVWLAFVTENRWNFHDSIILIVEVSLAHACKDISIKVSPVQFEQMVLREDDNSRGFFEFYCMCEFEHFTVSVYWSMFWWLILMMMISQGVITITIATHFLTFYPVLWGVKQAVIILTNVSDEEAWFSGLIDDDESETFI